MNVSYVRMYHIQTEKTTVIRLAIIGAQLRASLKPPRASQHYRNEGLKVRPHYSEKRQSLGQLIRGFLV